jgi:hypothetical protein
MNTISAARYLIFSALFLTACGSDREQKRVKDSIAQDSIERARQPLPSDSLSTENSTVQQSTDSGIATFDSAEIMKTLNVLDSIKAHKSK